MRGWRTAVEVGVRFPAPQSWTAWVNQSALCLSPNLTRVALHFPQLARHGPMEGQWRLQRRSVPPAERFGGCWSMQIHNCVGRYWHENRISLAMCKGDLPLRNSRVAQQQQILPITGTALKWWFEARHRPVRSITRKR